MVKVGKAEKKIGAGLSRYGERLERVAREIAESCCVDFVDSVRQDYINLFSRKARQILTSYNSFEERLQWEARIREKLAGYPKSGMVIADMGRFIDGLITASRKPGPQDNIAVLVTEQDRVRAREFLWGAWITTPTEYDEVEAVAELIASVRAGK